jgi:hypothetical protein
LFLISKFGEEGNLNPQGGPLCKEKGICRQIGFGMGCNQGKNHPTQNEEPHGNLAFRALAKLQADKSAT